MKGGLPIGTKLSRSHPELSQKPNGQKNGSTTFRGRFGLTLLIIGSSLSLALSRRFLAQPWRSIGFVQIIVILLVWAY